MRKLINKNHCFLDAGGRGLFNGKIFFYRADSWEEKPVAAEYNGDLDTFTIKLDNKGYPSQDAFGDGEYKIVIKNFIKETQIIYDFF